ncbi:VOC family protein [Roseibacterium sp. SDUM158016]|jgi:PhnB protein|uniref:VOC family protein n=1 Tax=Roseicyclus sediminis TaxID=2980997 RepID=UPI0021D21A79|nr:VOC family protein [Roseibacterium sp. SDUM158016]MCU4654826.1 VOC family protein [Roseibacterium sp. SDUM158016]
MHATPYVFFDGTCAEAMAFYAETLKADPPIIMRMADMPPEDQANMEGLSADAVMNAMLKKGDFELMASDGAPWESVGMAGCSIHLALDSVAEAHRVFEAFAEGGEVRMPMGATFWTPAFGTVTDRFGIRWMVSVEDGVA